MRASVVATAVVAVVAAAVVAVAVAGPRLLSDSSEINIPPTSEPLVANASPGSGTDVESLLRDSGQAVNISVVGDGTGRTLGAWLYGMAQDLGISYRRTVQIRDWRPGRPQSYTPARTVINAEGRPIVIWNASTSRNVRYFSDTIGQWVPASSPALVVVSNGAQEAPRALAARTIGLVDAIRARLPDATVVTLVQPVPPDRRPQTPNDDDPSRDLRTSLDLNQLPYIDVAQRVESSGSTDDFGRGRELMSADGYRLWADVVARALPMLPLRPRT